MNLLRNFLYFLLALGMLALGALFAVQNEARVPLDLLVVYLPEGFELRYRIWAASGETLRATKE